MKKTIIVALALVASASFCTVEAVKKKTPQPQTPIEEKVQLTSSTDSVSYAAGMTLTNGLMSYLLQQKMDTTLMADFVRGFKEAVGTADDPKMKAYHIGMNIAQQVMEHIIPGIAKEFEDTPDSIKVDLFCRGFVDAMMKDSTYFKTADAERFFMEKSSADKAARTEKLYGANRDASNKFLEENAKKEGVITLPSGLQYKILVKGEGEVPLDTDRVKVNYEGRLIDGTVFDASSQHGDEPSEFTASQVIRGWSEALTMMPVGSKWQLYIPYDMAYGERGAGNDIPPYSTLIFDVELVDIVR